jgi:hypothetical protein
MEDIQHVSVKQGSNECVYMRLDGHEHFVSFGRPEEFYTLLTWVRQFEKRLAGLPLDPELARRFVRAYFRMRSDTVKAANCMHVEVSTERHSLGAQAAAARWGEAQWAAGQLAAKLGILKSTE